MDKEQALLKIERHINDCNVNSFCKGKACGFISACLLMGLISADQAKDFQIRALEMEEDK